VRQKICGSSKIFQVLNFARKSEPGQRPVGPASQHNQNKILKTHLSFNGLDTIKGVEYLNKETKTK